MNQYKGWWNGVAAGDFDGDGRMDILAANWGRNSKYESLRGGGPVWMYHGDIDSNGTYECLYAAFDQSMKKMVPLQALAQVAGGNSVDS